MKKDLRRNAKARVVNQSVKSALKTYVKKVRTAAANGDSSELADAAVKAQKSLDKATQRGIIHPNQAARRKSRAMKAASAAVKGANDTQASVGTPKSSSPKKKAVPKKASPKAK